MSQPLQLITIDDPGAACWKTKVPPGQRQRLAIDRNLGESGDLGQCVSD